LDQLAATALFAAVLLIAAGVVWTKRKDAVSSIKLSYMLATLFTVLASASFHPWYALWAIPFLAFFPSPAWLYFSFALTLSYLAYVQQQNLLSDLIRHIEYIPFFVLLAVEYFFYQRPRASWFPWKPAVERDPREVVTP
jgi:drug/metabolite transporter (DMT)-like permease